MIDYEKFPLLAAREGATQPIILRFRKMVYSHFASNPRPLPWRETENPYHILVSEFMLQQTRVERVIGKYRLFIAAFPDFYSLSRASLQEVLGVWQGLGYNRRALSLKETARQVIERFAGVLPASQEDLATLPGIGGYTAAAIAAFAFHRPVTLIETNIRTVLIHCFFPDQQEVRDKAILPLVQATLDDGNPREWYYALMDFGVMLKSRLPNPSRRSAHHSRQAPFEGSDRQIRGKILRILLAGQFFSRADIAGLVGGDPERIGMILDQLEQEKFISNRSRGYSISK